MAAPKRVGSSVAASESLAKAGRRNEKGTAVTALDSLTPRRSMLFAPGLRPDRVRKALTAGADIVCVDLEDAVALQHKDEARKLTLELLGDLPFSSSEVVIRINSLDTIDGLRDVEALARAEHLPHAVMMTKVRSAAEVRLLDELLQGRAERIEFYVTLETNQGLEEVFEIAGASDRMACFLFGEVDLSADLRCRRTEQALLYARSRVVHAAARFGLDVIDVPHIQFDDYEGLRAASAHAAELGFTGKACIHPTQLPIIHEHFTPTADEVARAERAVKAFEESGESGLAVLDGLMLQKPVLRASQRILALADHHERQTAGAQA